ncbi:MAG TPA: PmoA family protein [Pyrinomonadaceae bacterium]|nr:PmoA family protein [Pyrinomonadaceae bacterium]
MQLPRLTRGRVAACLAIMFLILSASLTAEAQQNKKGVTVVPNEAARRVDVLVDGQLFTSYIWPDSLKKPVLYPLRTAAGTPVTRGYPLDPRPGERVDHPHHVGLWFNYGSVNGVDFWNNSTSLKPDEGAKMGTIVHRRVVAAKNGKDSGELEVESDWIMPDGKPVLRETTRFVFHSAANTRSVDRITKLTALDGRVVFKDNKEGVLGLRVARELEHPSKEKLVFTDASGKPTDVPAMNNEGVSGMYRSSEGKTGDDVWGTRGRWVTLSGKVNGEDVVVAMLDHPQNPGYPTYWHARGYGLFAANPLGQKVFSTDKKEATVSELNFTLEPKQSTTFRHRLLIMSGGAVAPEQLEAQYKQFVAGVK